MAGKILYIDIQGFTIPQFVPKELSATYDGENVKTYLFKSPVKLDKLPQKMQRTVLWLEKNHHGLKYSGGSINLHCINDFVREHPAQVVVVKGNQKCSFIKNFYSNVNNVEDSSTKFQKQWIFDCENHCMSYAVCSRQNVIELYNDNK